MYGSGNLPAFAIGDGYGPTRAIKGLRHFVCFVARLLHGLVGPGLIVHGGGRPLAPTTALIAMAVDALDALDVEACTRLLADAHRLMGHLHLGMSVKGARCPGQWTTSPIEVHLRLMQASLVDLEHDMSSHRLPPGCSGLHDLPSHPP